ncbi:hypothetical protein BHE90_015203 [Fusarium euwallaceae]|uniref:Uncharacterized protein n=1 Tax=Fusarium euwallaceae TaxID=1147111 RepID=A0A430L3S9_9HYPO|nr:hypothetical protein BHE90_015203 [Fusarium euwallaceae]
MSIPENDGRICLPATDFVDYSHVDLDMARAFLVDFGLTMVEDRGHEVYFEKASFSGATFEVESRHELERASEFSFYTPMYKLDAPGGGEAVTLTDPFGHNLHLVVGQAKKEATLLQLEKLTVNCELEKPRTGRFQRFEHRKYQVVFNWYTKHLAFALSDVVYKDGKPGLVTVTGTDSRVIVYSLTRYTLLPRQRRLLGTKAPSSSSSQAVGLRSRSASKARTHHLLRLPPTATPDKPDPSTAKSSGCTLMKPPDCTRTVSFISVGSGYSSTVFGECSYAMSCATGKQSTTTTVIDVQGQADNKFDNPEEEWADESGDSDQSSFDFFETRCDELGISFDSINNVKAECEGDEAQMNSIRLAPIAESIRQCAISYPFSVPEKGKVDAGCGTYSYKIMPFTKPTPTSSKPAEPSKTDYTGPSEG